jgi:hypothetical protein
MAKADLFYPLFSALKGRAEDIFDCFKEAELFFLIRRLKSEKCSTPY